MTSIKGIESLVKWANSNTQRQFGLVLLKNQSILIATPDSTVLSNVLVAAGSKINGVLLGGIGICPTPLSIKVELGFEDKGADEQIKGNVALYANKFRDILLQGFDSVDISNPFNN
jgi:hypothetical protein